MKKRYYSKNAWWVSPFHDTPEVRKQTTFGTVELCDTTLRGWGRGYGVTYSALEAQRIVEALVAVGIEQVELGLPEENAPCAEDIRNLVEEFPDTRFSVRTHAQKKEIQAAAVCGVGSVLISVPMGYPQMKYRLGWTWENALEHMVEAVGYARECGLRVIAAPEDIARANPEDLESYLKALYKQAKPDVFRIEDTTGCALPQAIDYIVRRVRQHLKGVPVQVAAGNDFGLATACSLSGSLAGAKTLCGSVNGLGKRLGVASTEELVLSLKILLGAPNDYAMEKLHELCLLVEEITGIHIGESKPFASHRSFWVDSKYVQGATEHPLLTFATDPRFFGRAVQKMPNPKRHK